MNHFKISKNSSHFILIWSKSYGKGSIKNILITLFYLSVLSVGNDLHTWMDDYTVSVLVFLLNYWFTYNLLILHHVLYLITEKAAHFSSANSFFCTLCSKYFFLFLHIFSCNIKKTLRRHSPYFRHCSFQTPFEHVNSIFQNDTLNQWDCLPLNSKNALLQSNEWLFFIIHVKQKYCPFPNPNPNQTGSIMFLVQF